VYKPVLSFLRSHVPLFQRFWLKVWVLRVSVDKVLFKPKVMQVNIGGGHFYKRGWKVLDFRTPWYRIPRQYIDYSLDLMSSDSFPFPDNSVQLFYSEHVLEHLPDQQREHVIGECYRCLENNGAVRFVVPDIDLAYEATKNHDFDFFYRIDEEYRQYTVIEQCLLHMFAGYFVRSDHDLDINESPESIQRNFRTMTKQNFLNHYSKRIGEWLTPDIQHRYGGIHVNWWNEEKLVLSLKKAGFQKVYRTNAYQSRFPQMQGSRFDTRPAWSLHMEAIKE